MSQYQQLLLIADAARPRSAAFERAAWLGRTTGARLHVSAFDHQYLVDAAGVIDQDGARHAREAWLQRVDGALERILLIDSTTEELLDRAACDILTVEPSPAT